MDRLNMQYEIWVHFIFLQIVLVTTCFKNFQVIRNRMTIFVIFVFCKEPVCLSFVFYGTHIIIFHYCIL